jgi:hypothetical protein
VRAVGCAGGDGERVVEGVHGEHDMHVAEGVDWGAPVIVESPSLCESPLSHGNGNPGGSDDCTGRAVAPPAAYDGRDPAPDVRSRYV